MQPTRYLYVLLRDFSTIPVVVSTSTVIRDRGRRPSQLFTGVLLIERLGYWLYLDDRVRPKLRRSRMLYFVSIGVLCLCT